MTGSGDAAGASPLPLTAEGVTAAWLSAALRTRYWLPGLPGERWCRCGTMPRVKRDGTAGLVGCWIRWPPKAAPAQPASSAAYLDRA